MQPPLDRLKSLLADGFHVRDIRSDPNALDVVVERAGIEITVSFAEHDAWDLFNAQLLNRSSRA